MKNLVLLIVEGGAKGTKEILMDILLMAILPNGNKISIEKFISLIQLLDRQSLCFSEWQFVLQYRGSAGKKPCEGYYVGKLADIHN